MKKILILFIIPLSIFAQTFESNLPIVKINTGNNEIVDDPRIIADMGIINNINGLNKLSDQHNEYNGKISIELRGSSSQDIFPKKS